MKNLFLSLVSIFFLVSSSYANLKVVPQRIEITVNPNVPIKGSYAVTNNYEDDITVEIFAELSKEWSYKGNLDIPIDSLLHIVPSKLTIKKGEERLVLYTIFPTENIHGSVVCQVKFKTNPPNSPTLNVIINLPIHIIMQGTEKIDYSVNSLLINDKTKKLNIGIKNDGNIVIHPAGMIDIYKGSKKLKSVQLLESVSVYPETIRNEFHVELPSDLAPGKYKAEASINLVGQRVDKPEVKSIDFRVNKDGSYQALK